ncbi:syntaxin 18 [Tachypleus tridentatus]|uniref:syntaxin 18 n=1 Tax=Tachypleus tridentatus TaxID=6853 RepID=UPI003FD19FF8
MDITQLFKACVKTMKTRIKALENGDGFKANSQFIMKNRKKSNFSIKLKEIVSSITRMRDFLLKHRIDYIDTNHLLYDASKMTDSERDQIDSDVQTFVETCSEVLRSLRSEVKKESSSNQAFQHKEAILSLVESYLKEVCKIYSEQKAIRVKRVFDRQKMLRLEPDLKKRKILMDQSEPSRRKQGDNSGTEVSKDRQRNPSGEKTSLLENEFEFSSEEIQMLEQENDQIYEEMNSLVDEVRQIEGKVVEISKLQEIFTEKVLQQESDANRIAETVAGTTENIIEGNEELREAMKKNAGFRVWILFFLLVISFSLLFLDWYNP